MVLFVDSACPLDWGCRCCEGKLYAPVLVELLKIVACELGSVVGDELLGDPKASDYARPQEFADLEVCYPAECFCFDPF